MYVGKEPVKVPGCHSKAATSQDAQASGNVLEATPWGCWPGKGGGDRLQEMFGEMLLQRCNMFW